MRELTIKKIAEICNGKFYIGDKTQNQEISSITTDSRKIEKDCMFVAIKGERADGNKFIDKAYEDGALVCLSENEPDANDVNISENKGYIVVKSCFQALKDIAEFYREVMQTKIVGITGSVGKTSTKEMLASVMSEKFNTLKTQGNFNNEVGVPLTLFRLREEHELAIVEMGIRDFGEMSRLGQIVKPDMCVITNIGQCHLENLGDRDGVLKAKTEIFNFIKDGGKAFLNGDDDKLATVKEVNGLKPVFFGFDKKNDVYATDVETKGLAGTSFTAVTPKGKKKIRVNVPGHHMVSNALAAVAIGLELGLNENQIAAGVAAFEPVSGHSSIVETKHFTIMDDCYNANPVSTKAGIDVLTQTDERKIAILGDMFELGADERKMHYEVGEYAAKKGIDCIVCAGELAKEYYDGAKAAGRKENLYYFQSRDEAIENLKDIVKENDAILVKASHGMKFEKIVEVLKQM